jgi:hypothetical protein
MNMVLMTGSYHFTHLYFLQVPLYEQHDTMRQEDKT